MIGNALRIDIEQWVARRDEKPLYVHTKAGTLTGDMLARYLASLHYLISHTPIHLTRARERARAAGDEALAAHMQHKFDEEIGHHVWAERDLEELARTGKSTSRGEAMPSAVLLARAVEAAIDEDPCLYLAYIAFVEYVTVMVGPEWMELLHERCGIPRTSVTVIDNHVDLDREHAEEGFAVMDDLVGDPKMLPKMREAMRGFTELFDAYCAEAVGARPIPVPEESGTHVIVDVAHAAVA